MAAGIGLAAAAPPEQTPDAPTVRPADLTELSLEQLMDLPVVTVVTASKREQTTTQAPAQATVVTAQDIQQYGYRTLADILRSVPGFYVTYDRSYGFVGVRGFGRPGDYGGRILLLMDGHRLNDPLYDLASVVNDFILEVDLIDRVEIIRGPGSTLYGNNAFFAVVNVITKQAAQVEHLQIAAEAGTYDTYKGRLTYGTRASNGTALIVSASGLRSHGNPSVYFPEYDSPETANGVVHDGDAEEYEKIFGSLRHGGLTVSAAYCGRDKDNPSPSYGTMFGTSVHNSDERALAEVRYNMAVRDDLTGVARIYYDWYDYTGDWYYNVAESDTAPEIVINRDECHSESVGSEIQLDWRASAHHEVTLGTEFRADFRAELRNYDVSPRTDYLDIDRDLQSFGFYVQDEYQPLSNLSVTAGVRFDYFSTFGGTVNPRLACVYTPVAATTIKMLYGQAYRAPNVSEFFYDDDGMTTKTNADLEPETIDTYEMVCERKLGRHWRGSVSGFFNNVENLINMAQDPADSLYYFENVDRVDASGLEFQLEGQLQQNLSGQLSYTLTRTEDDATGEPLDNSPTHLAKFNLTAPVLSDWLTAGAEVQYTSDRTTLAGATLDDLWLFNATLLARSIRDRWDLSLSAHNLFDTHYSDPAFSPDAVEQDGRTLRLKLVAHF